MVDVEQVSEFYFIADMDNPVLTPDNFDVIVDAMDVSCVMIDDTVALNEAPEKARAIISHIQSHGVAVLIKNAADMAGAVGADGIHLDMEQNFDARFAEAHARISGDAVTGVEVANSRHAAMTCAEKGADYIAFACQDDEMIEMIGWWAELFEIPSVAWRVIEPEFAGRCSEAGVDFIALDLEEIAIGASPMDALAAFEAAIDNVSGAT